MVTTSSTGIPDANQLAPRLVVAGTGAGVSEQPAAPDPLLGQILDGRYRLVERLAEGGMGTVYRAEHIALRKDVAIKLVQDGENADHARRFLREAMVISRIDHPNVISAIDYGTAEQGAGFLVMSLVEGPTLAHVMRADRPMSWLRAAKIGAQIADAVAAAHAHGIVHRDLKPENIVLQPMADGTEVVKVLDFGLAKYTRDSLAPPQVRGAQQVTRTGVVVGTPGFMAPEQAVGIRADHRVDLYALGVMLWECVVGHRLWDCGDDVQRLLTTQLSSRPERLRVASGDPSIPEAFEALVAQLLATRPEHRPESAVETRERLRALVAAAPVEIQPHAQLLPAAQPPIAHPPPDTDTLFIDAALVGWRAGAGKARREPGLAPLVDEALPPTRELTPIAAERSDEEPKTLVGFRAAAIAQSETAPHAAEEGALQLASAASAASQPALPAVAELADPVAVERAARVSGEPRAPFRVYVAAAFASVFVALGLWAVLAAGSTVALSPVLVRAQLGPPAAPSVEAQLEATRPVAINAPAASSPQASAPRNTAALTTARPAEARAGAQAVPVRSLPSPKRDEPEAGVREGSEPALANELRNKARTHFRRAEFELAAQAYRQAIEAAPRYAGAYAGLGASQLAVGDARGAIASYKQAIRRSPGSSGFHAALGRAYLMTLDRANAAAEYRKAVALDPANEIAQEALARLTL
jgi:serine/threonine protein kinase